MPFLLVNIWWVWFLLPNTAWKVSIFGVFLVRSSPHSDWIRRGSPYLSVFVPIVGKYGPEKLRIRTLFTQWRSFRNTDKFLGIENEPSKICARQPIKKWSDIVCLSRPYHCKFLKRLSSTNLTWSFLECLVPNNNRALV